MEEYISLLCGTKLFCGIEEEELKQLLRCFGCGARRYEAGAVLLRQGDPVRAAGILLAGEAEAKRVWYDGRETQEAIFTAGELFGDVLMASDGENSPVRITARRETTVLYLPFDKVMGACGNACACHTRLRMNLLGEIAEKFWSQSRRIGYLRLKGLRERIALYLLDESRRTGKTCLTLPYTREELAALLCVNRSALSRELMRMQQEGLLRVERRSIQLLERERLSGLIDQG